MLQKPIPTEAFAFDPDAIARAGHPIRSLTAGVSRSAFHRNGRLHNKMKPAIRPDHDRELIEGIGIVSSGDIEDPLRVVEENVHQ